MSADVICIFLLIRFLKCSGAGQGESVLVITEEALGIEEYFKKQRNFFLAVEERKALYHQLFFFSPMFCSALISLYDVLQRDC